MLLSQNIDAIVLATKKERENIYALDSVMVTEEKIYASNGHCLYWSENKEKDTEWPGMTVEQTNNGVESFPAILPRMAIEKAIKNRPKKPLNETFNNILMQVKDNKASLTTTDGKYTETVKTNYPSEFAFPDVQQIIDAIHHEDEKECVTISIENLELLCKVIKKTGNDKVKIELRGPLKPVKVKSGEIDGLIMPMRV